jgi:hypothetical protein
MVEVMRSSVLHNEDLMICNPNKIFRAQIEVDQIAEHVASMGVNKGKRRIVRPTLHWTNHTTADGCALRYDGAD